MADYDERDFAEANQIVEGLTSNEGEKRDLPHGLVISDIEEDARDFNDDLDFLDDLGMPVPAIQIGGEDVVPVALDTLLPAFPRRAGARRWWRRSPYLSEILYGFEDHVSAHFGPNGGVEWIPHKQARSTFVRRAADFLATRIATMRAFRDRGELSEIRGTTIGILTLPQRLRGATIGTPGCVFSVETRTHGLRVFWSGAYRVSENYFGHPTSPAQGMLQSGTYIFGIDGGAYKQAQWDRSAVVSLPGTPSVYLNF